MAQAVSRRPGLDPGAVHEGFVVDKVALRLVFFPEYFGFPLLISFHRCSITRKNETSFLFRFSSFSSSSQGCTISVKAAVRP
jgi:hypothetical protein